MCLGLDLMNGEKWGFDSMVILFFSYFSHPIEELNLVFFVDVIWYHHLSRCEHALTLECTANIALFIYDKNLIFVFFRAFLMLST